MRIEKPLAYLYTVCFLLLYQTGLAANPTGIWHQSANTPCATCHSGHAAPGKSKKHISSSNLCEACHYADRFSAFTPVRMLDHNQVRGTCNHCHRIPPGHFPIVARCNHCHKKTRTWEGAVVVHHDIVSGCANCHDGSYAKGKSATHTSSTDRCETCHFSTSFSPARAVDHMQIVNVNLCDNCHSLPKGHFPPLGTACRVCHANTHTWVAEL